MITNALIISLIVLAIHSFTWEGMIFEPIKKIIKPEGMLYKPIYGCPICMTPWWGTLIYLIFIHLSIADWFLTVGAATGLSVISVVLVDLREACLIYIKKNEGK